MPRSFDLELPAVAPSAPTHHADCLLGGVHVPTCGKKINDKKWHLSMLASDIAPVMLLCR
jgi:hypothetical protein